MIVLAVGPAVCVMQELENRRRDSLRIEKYMEVMGAAKTGEDHPRIALAKEAVLSKPVKVRITEAGRVLFMIIQQTLPHQFLSPLSNVMVVVVFAFYTAYGQSLTHGMLYRKLGKSDLLVSEVCLGCMTWGEQTTDEQAHAQLDMAFDEYNINFVVGEKRHPCSTTSVSIVR